MIAEKAMLAAVHISVWTATKHDKDVSRQVAEQNGAHESAGRYNKKLLQQAAKLDAIRTLAGQIRTHVYKITLPWSDEGYRILPASLYFQLADQMKAFERRSIRRSMSFWPSIQPTSNKSGQRSADSFAPRIIRMHERFGRNLSCAWKLSRS